MDISLYDFQTASAEALRCNIRGGVYNQVLSAPTGSGKTVIAAHLLEECYRKPGKRAVFVADRVALVEQTSRVLDRYGIPHGVIQAQHWRRRSYERIQVASSQTLAQRGWPDANLIIVDEAHTLQRDTLSRISRRNTVAIGLTATPFAKGMGKHYDAVVSVTTTNRLIADRLLCPYRIFAASEPDMKGAKIVSGEWTKEDAARRSMPIVGDCVAEYLRHTPDKKFICFGVNVAHCEELQRQFLASGVHVALYTHRTGEAERSRLVDEFRKRDSYIRGLISVSALAKGFDVEDVETIIMARPLRNSLAEHIQIFGRGLRSDPMNPSKICTILDHSGNTIRFWDRTEDFFENGADTLDDGKRKEVKKQERKEKEPRKCPKCYRVHAPAPMCPHCGHAYASTSRVEHVAGELREMGSGGATREQKQDVYSQLLSYARQKGRQPGWVKHRYRERFGVWPTGMRDVEKPLTDEISRWIWSRNIAYAKSKGGAR